VRRKMALRFGFAVWGALFGVCCCAWLEAIGHLINGRDRKRRISSGAKARFCVSLNVGAKAPTP
jgi:hypothetical protein